MNEDVDEDARRAGRTVMSMGLVALIVVALAWLLLDRQNYENDCLQAEIDATRQEIVDLQEEADKEAALLATIAKLQRVDGQ